MYANVVMPTEATCGWKTLYYNTVDELLRMTPARDMVEIGVAYGFHLRHLMQHHPQLNYVGVDPYLAGYDDKDPFCADVAVMFDEHDAHKAMAMLGDAVSAMAAEEYGARCTLVREPSVVAAAKCKQQFDLVFIDGDHTYNAVLQDLMAWWPHVRSGGILCCDDYVLPAVRQAVVDFARQIGRTRIAKKTCGTKYPICYFEKA